MKNTAMIAVLGLLAMGCNAAKADTFGTGGNTFSLDFTTIGNPGNAADTTGTPNPVGAVGYTYRIGTYEVSRDMITKANAAMPTLVIPLADMISSGGNIASHPATGVSWNEAARFVNWLNTSSGYSAAYKFATQPGDGGYNVNEDLVLWQSGDAGYDAANAYRNSNAFYFLPSVDEWYKAAYYNSGSSSYYDYATGSNTAPTIVAGGTAAGSAVYSQTVATGPADITNAGGLSPYGTMGQGGNVAEWNESAYSGSPDPASFRVYRGGQWGNDSNALKANSTSYNDAWASPDYVGFRVASIPEPLEWQMFLMAVAALVGWRYLLAFVKAKRNGRGLF